MEKSYLKNLWLEGAVIAILILPWTKIVMIPDIMKLLKDDVITERGNLIQVELIRNYTVYFIAERTFCETHFFNFST